MSMIAYLNSPSAGALLPASAAANALGRRAAAFSAAETPGARFFGAA